MSTEKSDRLPHAISLQSRIPNDAKGQSLLGYLARRFPYLDRAGWQAELNDGRVALDDQQASGYEQLQGGMRLRYQKLHREPQVSLNFRVLHHDDSLLAVDKPAHLPMHADGPFIRNTLIYRLREQFGDGLQLVHRLDRETSGICIVATNKAAQAAVQAQFAQASPPNGKNTANGKNPPNDQNPTPPANHTKQLGTVRKSYLAVVHGLLQRPLRCEQAIGHASNSIITLRRSAATDAKNTKPAATSFEPLRYGPNKTLLRCSPETGRTHQIRVHLEHAGYPIVGDKLYGHEDAHYLAFVARMKAGESVFEDTQDAPNRHLLHAHQIHLHHPTSGVEQCFEAPIPAEFERWLLS